MPQKSEYNIGHQFPVWVPGIKFRSWRSKGLSPKSHLTSLHPYLLALLQRPLHLADT